jgi:beta-N-acetylhexosaminidase
MAAIAQGPGLVVDAIAAAAAGVDLLLLIDEPEEQETIYAALVQAARRGLLPAATVQAAAGRVLALKTWLAAQPQPSLDVIGCEEHRTLALTIAARALTLVRDTAGRLPLQLAADARVAAVVPRPEDLTPADTSSFESPALAAALRRYHPAVDEFIIPLNPTEAEVAALREQMRGYDLAVVGTINAPAHPGQAALVNAVLADGVPLVAVALRLPYDIMSYPSAPTYVCTYSLQPPSLEALAAALWGHGPFAGRLPIPLPGF